MSRTCSRRAWSASGESGSSSSRLAIERCVREVGQRGAVPGEQQLARVVPVQEPRVHLRLEEHHAPVEHRAQDEPELLGEHRPAVERLAPDQAHELGVILEELERGAHDPLDLRPAAGRVRDRVVDERAPVGEVREQDLLVERFLRREVVQEARPLDADLVGDLREAGRREAVIGEPPAGDDDDQLLGPCPAGGCLHSPTVGAIRRPPRLCYPGARARMTSLVRSGAARIIGIGVVTPSST